jgi:ABC-type sugar transport system substrate-binding protein
MTENRKIKVALSMSERDQWLSNLEAAAKAKANELGIELSVQDANRDIAAQLSHVQAAANQGFDVMIVGLVNTSNAQEIIDAAGDHMAIVFVNRRPDDSVLLADRVVYVGSTESDAGRIQGDFLSGLFKREGKTEINCVMFQGSLGAQHAVERTAAAKKAFRDNGITATYVFDDTADWDRSKAMEKFIQFAGMGVPYDAVVCNNDEMALGVVEALKTLGGNITVPIAGIDATANAIEAVENGDLACSVFQNAVGQGGTSVEVAYKIATGKGAEILNLIPFELVTKENVNQYKGANKG